jgi:hypothetical protein
MSDVDDGGSVPDDGREPRPRGLPGLPPEWGPVVVPDDASALSAEAEAVRRELGRGRRAGHRGEHAREPVPLRLPLGIMAVAVLTTLLSLVLLTWSWLPSPAPSPPGRPTAPRPTSQHQPNAPTLPTGQPSTPP